MTSNHQQTTMQMVASLQRLALEVADNIPTDGTAQEAEKGAWLLVHRLQQLDKHITQEPTEG